MGWEDEGVVTPVDRQVGTRTVGEVIRRPLHPIAQSIGVQLLGTFTKDKVTPN